MKKFSFILFAIVLSGCATSAKPYLSPYELTKNNSEVSSTKTNNNAGKNSNTSTNRNVSTANARRNTSTANARRNTNTANARRDNNSNHSNTKVSSNYYTVKKGDTLFSIAFDNNIELKTLVLINNLNQSNTIYVGQKLLINPDESVYKTYRVQNKDTVYRISKNFGISIDELRRWNGIDSSNNIIVGQFLIVGKKNQNSNTASMPTSTSNPPKPNNAPMLSNNSNSSTNTTKPEQVTRREDNKTDNIRDYPKPTAAPNKGKLAWQWPFIGNIINYFSASNKGIDIAGMKGNIIKSAAPGKIVYAGNALRGYGNLIIINHNDDFLSAYAHNDSILVKEGDVVKAGQSIAKMGDTDSKNVCLHFEIRYKGQSVNPLNYLPKRK